jgi:hypothetical protein
MSTISRPRSNAKMEENLGLPTCLKMNCFKQGPHRHNNASENYNYGNNTIKPFRLSNAVGINEKAVRRQTIKNYRNRNRALAKNSLRNNLKRHTRRA